MYQSLENPRAPDLSNCLFSFDIKPENHVPKILHVARCLVLGGFLDVCGPPKSHQGLNISNQIQPDPKELKRSLSSIIQAVFESLIFTQMTIIIISIGWHLTKGDDKIIDNHVR